MPDEASDLAPALAREAPASGLEPSIAARRVDLDGIGFTRLADRRVEGLHLLVPTPEAGTVVMFLGDRYERLDLLTGARHPLALPADLHLVALDDVGRYYLLGDDSETLVRYTADLRPDLRLPLRGQRDLTIGRDGNLYTWLFKQDDLVVYDPAGRLLRVLPHSCTPYALAVEADGTIWLGEASICQVLALDPATGATLRDLDPKDDRGEENLFTYTYAMALDRANNLWTYNGQGPAGSTIISPDRAHYIRFASGELDPTLADAEPIPSPWHPELYLATDDGVVSLFRPEPHGWKPITPNIHART